MEQEGTAQIVLAYRGVDLGLPADVEFRRIEPVERRDLARQRPQALNAKAAQFVEHQFGTPAQRQRVGWQEETDAPHGVVRDGGGRSGCIGEMRGEAGEDRIARGRIAAVEQGDSVVARRKADGDQPVIDLYRPGPHRFKGAFEGMQEGGDILAPEHGAAALERVQIPECPVDQVAVFGIGAKRQKPFLEAFEKSLGLGPEHGECLEIRHGANPRTAAVWVFASMFGRSPCYRVAMTSISWGC